MTFERMFLIWTAILLFLIAPFVANGRLSVYAEVYINEIYPKTQDVSLEWIELFNNGTSEVSLDRWSLENTKGETKKFTLNASSIIPAHGFLSFTQSQTGISLNKEGDTVKLTNEKNDVVDTESYYGTLGYNISVGRTNDGGGVWATCTEGTQNLTNKCPTPTSTPTPLPTAIPLPTPTTEVLPSLTPTQIILPTFTPSPSPTTTAQVLGTQGTLTVQPKQNIASSSSSGTENKLRILGWAILVIGIVWALIVGTFYTHTRMSKPKINNPLSS